jgi:hypothetical protein
MQVNGQLHATASLSPGKCPRHPLDKAREKSLQYPLDRRLGESQNRSGQCEDKKISCFFRESNLDSSFVQHLASWLYRLSYPGSLLYTVF